MHELEIYFGKTYEQQSFLIIVNMITKGLSIMIFANFNKFSILISLFKKNKSSIRKEIKSLIQNKYRAQFRTERKKNPNALKRKQDHSEKPDNVQKRWTIKRPHEFWTKCEL